MPTYRIFSSEGIDEIANTLGNVSRIDTHWLWTELLGIAYRYELECQALTNPSFSEQRSQFKKIQNAADVLLKHLFDEDHAQGRVVQSGHFWEMPKALLKPLRQATEIEVRVLHQEWREEWSIMQGHTRSESEEGQDEEGPDYDPNFAPLPYPHGIEEQGEKNRINSPLNAAIWAVRLIRRAAATEANAATSHTKPGRGGNRNKKKYHEIVLLESLFQLHHDLHRQDPTHIGPPSISTTSDGDINGVTLRFTVACLANLGRHAPELCDITDDTIRHRFRDWQAKSIIQKT